MLKISTGSWLTSWLFTYLQNVEELKLGTPNANALRHAASVMLQKMSEIIIFFLRTVWFEFSQPVRYLQFFLRSRVETHHPTLSLHRLSQRFPGPTSLAYTLGIKQKKSYQG